MRHAFFLAAVLAVLVLLVAPTLVGCDTAAPSHCPAPWTPDACPDSVRVTP